MTDSLPAILSPDNPYDDGEEHSAEGEDGVGSPIQTGGVELSPEVWFEIDARIDISDIEVYGLNIINKACNQKYRERYLEFYDANRSMVHDIPDVDKEDILAEGEEKEQEEEEGADEEEEGMCTQIN